MSYSTSSGSESESTASQSRPSKRASRQSNRRAAIFSESGNVVLRVPSPSPYSLKAGGASDERLGNVASRSFSSHMSSSFSDLEEDTVVYQVSSANWGTYLHAPLDPRNDAPFSIVHESAKLSTPATNNSTPQVEVPSNSVLASPKRLSRSRSAHLSITVRSRPDSPE